MITDLAPYPAMKDSQVDWLGEVPEHWEVRRNGRLFAQRNETGFSELPILEVSLNTGVRVRDFESSNRKQVMSDRDKYKRALPGDIAYNTMRMWQGAVGVAPTNGLISPAYVIARPLPGTESRYFEKLFRTPVFMQEVDNYSRGIVKDRNRLYWEDFKAIPVCYPPEEEQTAIVRYLDHVDRRVRRLVRAKRKLVALLAEQKQAIIHRAVTRGLDPDVPLKDSGVEWLGEVPEHWQVQRLKALITEAVAGPYGSSLTKSMYTSAGYRVYGQQQVIPDDFSVGDYYIPETKFQEMGRYQVHPGDVLVSVMGTVGRVAVVPETAEAGIINPRLVRYRPNPERVRSRYLQLAMLSPSANAQLSEGAKGTTMEGLNMQILGRLELAIPPLDHQDMILAAIGRKTELIDQAIIEANQHLGFIQEYRTRLIADVVTGKLDVRKAAAALPEVDPLDTEVGSDDALETDAEPAEEEGTEDDGEAEGDS